MNTPSMEVIFLILSGVILMAGILYWFWSHIQLTQKKVQLLENAVFELRGMLANKPPEPPAPASSEHVVAAATTTAPASSTYKDLDDDEEEQDWVAPATTTSTPLEALENNDLMPGGVAPPPPALVVEEEVSLEKKLAERTQQESQFRELFVPASSPKTEATTTTVTQVQPASLEAMPVKELRRLAEERGIAGAADMRKKDILTALRSQIPAGTEERTVDISELVKAEEAAPSTEDIKEIPIHE